jgi:hypothetical protein
MKKLIFLIGILFAIRVDAAMVRVVDVQDGRTLVIERNGSREPVRLAGLTIVDEARAVDLLRWTVVSFWVMLEPHAGGGYVAYRSPDALFINRELVLRGYARATAQGIEPERNLVVTYLGVIDPPLSSTASQSRTDTSRRSPATRAPRTGHAAPRASGRARATAPKPR